MKNIEEKNITYKRKYKDHPPLKMGERASVRNKVIKEIGNSEISIKQLENILSKYSKDYKKWIKRNSHFFQFKKNTVKLSRLGKNALKTLNPKKSNVKPTSNIVKEDSNLSDIDLEEGESIIKVPYDYQSEAIDAYKSNGLDDEIVQYDVEKMDGDNYFIAFFPRSMKNEVELFYYELIDQGVPDSKIEIIDKTLALDHDNKIYIDFESFVNEQILKK